MRDAACTKNTLLREIQGLCAAIAIFCLPNTVDASVVFTEIMYDLPGSDTGREWIEVQNIGEAPIDLTTWKLFEAETNHKISSVVGTELAPGAFGVIVDSPEKFRVDNPGYSGPLFDSAFSLGNEGETLVLKDASSTAVDSVSYLPAWGGAGDGNSIQRKAASDSWIASLPTAGSVTTATQSSIPSGGDGGANASTTAVKAEAPAISNDTGISAHQSQEVANISPDDTIFEVTSGRSRLGFVGSPLSFKARVKSAKNISGNVDAESTWSLGDGVSLFGQSIEHSYSYAGDYVVVLNSKYGVSQAVSKTLVKIIEPKVYISAAMRDYIEVSNPGAFEINIGGYSLVSEKGRFIMPQDTILLPHSSLRMAYASTKISSGRIIRLIDPSGSERSSSAFSIPVPVEEMMVDLPQGITEASIRRRYEAFQKSGVDVDYKAL